MDKKESRSFAKKHIQAISPFDKKKAGDLVLKKVMDFFDRVGFHRGTIGLYRNDAWEVPIADWEESFPHLKICYPKVLSTTRIEFFFPEGWEVGEFGIWEPVGKPLQGSGELDFAIIPGLGFNTEGFRLGRGKGYYDRYFEAYQREQLIGVCFHSCSGMVFPESEKDISVGTLFTEKGEISFLD